MLCISYAFTSGAKAVPRLITMDSKVVWSFHCVQPRYVQLLCVHICKTAVCAATVCAHMYSRGMCSYFVCTYDDKKQENKVKWTYDLNFLSL